MTKLEWALAHVAAGWHVFPLPPNSKKPSKDQNDTLPMMGVHSASDAETQVRAWWEQWPDANIAGTGFLVLDCDDKEGESGLLNLDVYCAQHGIELPETLEFRSQSGGRHLIYRADPALPFGQGDITKGVNVRAPYMGYILLPGSTIDGREYTVAERRAIAAAPAAIQEASAKGQKKREGPVEVVGELDLPVNVARMEADLKGQGGRAILASNPGAFAAACRYLDWGVHPGTIKEAGLPYCQPSWVTTWYNTVDNAVRYRQNDIGGTGTAGGGLTEGVINAVAEKWCAQQEEEERLGFPMLWRADFTQPPANYRDLVHDLIPAGEFGIFYGKWGGLKTFFAVYVAGAWSSGMDVLGRKSYGAERKVCYIAAEAALSVRKRFTAFEKHFGVELSNVAVVPVPVQIIDDEHRRVLAEQLRGQGFGLVIIDTLSKSTAGADDNSKQEMSLMVAACEYLCRELGVTVIGIGHEGKNSSGTMRGSSDIEAGAAFLFRTEKVSTNPPRARVELRKNKDGASELEFYLKGTEVTIPWRKENHAEDDAILVLDWDEHAASEIAAEAKHRETRAQLARNSAVAEVLRRRGGVASRPQVIEALAGVKGCSKTALEAQYVDGTRHMVPGDATVDGVDVPPSEILVSSEPQPRGKDVTMLRLEVRS